MDSMQKPLKFTDLFVVFSPEPRNYPLGGGGKFEALVTVQ